MTVDPNSVPPSEVQAIDAQASILMKQGIGLLDDPQPESIAQALSCFDRALELRKRLPIETSPMLRYGLAACWLNRADALMRLQQAEQIPVALQSFDEAIVLLQDLPLQEDARFPRRLAIAHQNRALALHAQNGGNLAEIAGSFSKAIAVLDDVHAAAVPDRLYLLATVCTNLANAYVSDPSSESIQLAQQAALRAIATVADQEPSDPASAELGLKARHVLCQALAHSLSQTPAGAGGIPDDVHEATDAVDAGLGLVRQWEQKGEGRFRDIAADLFRFGMAVYARYQPQFLNEFILENMDPSQSSSDYVESMGIRPAAPEAQNRPGA